MCKAKFVKFIGNCWLNGKDVAQYSLQDGSVRFVAETVGGKRLASKTLPSDQADMLVSEWTNGGAIYRGDARITAEALRFLGVVA